MLHLLIAATMASASPPALDVCHGDAVAPPIDQWGRYVPGLGRATGLNDDFHDDFDDVFDVPGDVLSMFAREGLIQLLSSGVGADCPIEVEH